MKEKNNPNVQKILYLAIGSTIAFMLYIAFFEKRLKCSANIWRSVELGYPFFLEAVPVFLPNFWRNFSTLPAVSTIFCVPV